MFWFLLPAVALYTLLFAFPMGRALYLSFFHGGPASPSYDFAGIANFEKLASDHIFWRSLWHNLQFVLLGGTATIVLALAIAFGLTRCGRGRDFFRLVFLFPNIMAVVATTILWSFIFNPSFGVLNGSLRALGLSSWARAWLGEPGTALPAVIAIHVWSTVGFYIVLFYAGMLRIPGDYIDAAKIDGAGVFQEFRHITLPLIREVLQIGIVYVVVNAINVFALVFLINEGRPGRYNGVLLTYMYEQAFQNGNYGYACAIGVVVLLILLLAITVVQLLAPKEPVEI